MRWHQHLVRYAQGEVRTEDYELNIDFLCSFSDVSTRLCGQLGWLQAHCNLCILFQILNCQGGRWDCHCLSIELLSDLQGGLLTFENVTPVEGTPLLLCSQI